MKYSLDIGAKVISSAARFVGLTEVRSNTSWDLIVTAGKDAIAEEFHAELLRVGWQDGWPYCAAFCEVAWKMAYQGRPELPKVRTMLTPGVLQSFHNAAEQGWTSKEPKIGAIGIMRNGETEHGHAFLIRGWTSDKIATIEANTSPASGDPLRDREGDGVYMKERNFVFAPTTGLHLIGFIHPCTEF